MARKGIGKHQVFKAAKELVATGNLPTATQIRSILTTGSMATIQKYLQEWKKSCFNQANIELISNAETRAYQQLIEEQRILTESLNKQVKQNEHYAQELINTEKANVLLKEDYHQLQAKLQAIQLELKESRAINKVLEQITIEIKSKLENNDNKTIQNLEQTVESLRAELKKINETGLEVLREASTKGHEVLMQEKVISINLQAKVDSLYKELMDGKKQSNDAALKYQAQTQVLLRQIDWQQKIIKEHLGPEKLRALVGEQELMLNFNNEGAAYAK